MNSHWTDDELIDRLYGMDPGDHRCAECEARLQAMQRMRAEAAKMGEPSRDFLAAQRRAIYSRLGERVAERRAAMVWAPAAVAVLCLAAGGIFALHGPVRDGKAPAHAAPHVTARAESDDSQLFSDVYAMEQTSEPRAAEPIHALIEEN